MEMGKVPLCIRAAKHVKALLSHTAADPTCICLLGVLEEMLSPLHCVCLLERRIKQAAKGSSALQGGSAPFSPSPGPVHWESCSHIIKCTCCCTDRLPWNMGLFILYAEKHKCLH